MNSIIVHEYLNTHLSNFNRQKGVKYLLMLLEKEDREFTYINLYHFSVDTPELETRKYHKETPIPMTDKQTISEVLKRMKAINAIGNGQFDKNIEEEKEKLLVYLHEVTKNGHILCFQNEQAKCKKGVVEAIRHSLLEIKKLYPEAYQYLNERLIKGNYSIKLCANVGPRLGTT